MSMHWGAEEGYGMFLNMDEAAEFKRNFVLHPAEQQNDIPTEEEDIKFEMGDVSPDIGATDLDDDSGDIRRIWHLDGKEHPEDDDSYVSGMFIYGDRQGSIFRNNQFEQNTYVDLNDMANEFKQNYGRWLPADFNYQAHMAHLLATNFG